jgi:SAM-dependent methyltransferase
MPDQDSLTIEGRAYRAGSDGAHTERVYANEGNPPLIELLSSDRGRILDVGCGAGDNARVIRRKFPHLEIHGITHSQTEADLAAPFLASCRVFDVEGDLPLDFAGMSFDVLIFSHVLEHLRHPALVLRRFSRLLRQHGAVLIAVPNTLSWAMRWQFLRGDFEYTRDGVLDDTHLRFFTYFTADRYLLSGTPRLRVTSKTVTGNVPLWLLRRYLLPSSWSASLDELGCRLWPNLFGSQVLIKAVLDDSGAAA